jgi:hypothetical protein
MIGCRLAELDPGVGHGSEDIAPRRAVNCLAAVRVLLS